MSTRERKDNAHMQTDINEAGLVVVASAWSVFYLMIIVMALSGQTLGGLVEVAARN